MNLLARSAATKAQSLIDAAHAATPPGLHDGAGLLLDIGAESDTVMIACSGGVRKGEVGYPRSMTSPHLPVRKIFVADFSIHWYYKGLPGLTGSFDETVDLLGEIVHRLGARVVASVGTSSGGYMALAVGALLNLDRSLAFAPQTNIASGWLSEHDDKRWPKYMAAIHEHLGAAAPYDIAQLVGACRHRTAFHVVYPTQFDIDALHAHRLAGLPGVTLYGLDAKEHNTAAALQVRDKLKPVIEAYTLLDGDALRSELSAIMAVPAAA